MKNFKKSIIAATMATALSACGGGGDSSSAPTTTPDVIPNHSTKISKCEVGYRKNTVGVIDVAIACVASSSHDIVRYHWEQIGGTEVEFSNGQMVTNFKSPKIDAEEVLTFKLTVTDSKGGVVSKNIAYTAPIYKNQLPIIELEHSRAVRPGNSFDISPILSDNDGVIKTVKWKQISGPTVGISDPNQRNITVTTPKVDIAQTVLLELIVTDDDGGETRQQIKIHLTDPINGGSTNASPTVNAGKDLVVTEGDTVNLSGTATDPDGTIFSYLWKQTAGTTKVKLTTPNHHSTQFTAPAVDEDSVFQFTLIATDNQGASAESNVSVTIKNAPEVVNTPPVVITNGNLLVQSGQKATLSASASDADGDIVAWLWKQTSGKPQVKLEGENTATATFTVPEVTEKSDIEFSVTVTDDAGSKSSAIQKVTLMPLNQVPTVSIQGKDSGEAFEDELYTLKAIVNDPDAIDPDNPDLIYQWNETSGKDHFLTDITTDEAILRFPTPSTDTHLHFTFEVLVTDPLGGSASAQYHLTVAPTAFNNQDILANLTRNQSKNATFVDYADVDGDFDNDVIVSTSEKVSWYEKQDGVYGKEHLIANKQASFLSVADIDNDGYLDVVIPSHHYDDEQLGSIYWGSKTGHFTPTVLPNIEHNGVLYSMSLKDLDGDTKLDLVFTAGNSLHAIHNKGERSFGVPTTLVTKEFSNITQHHFVDLDGDLDEDLLLMIYNTAYYAEKLDDGSFSVLTAIDVANKSGRINDIVLITESFSDNSGYLPGFAVTHGNSISYYQNLSNWKFKQYELTNTIRKSQDLSSVDINNDGHLDLIAIDGYSSELYQFERTSDNDYQLSKVNLKRDYEKMNIRIRASQKSETTGDVTIVTSALSGSPSMFDWFKEVTLRGDSVLGESHITSSQNHVTHIDQADIDGDGDLDILGAGGTRYSNSFSSLSWYQNHGDNFFSQVKIETTLREVDKAIPIDIDSDGDLDIVATNGSKLLSFINDGKGNFDEETLLHSGHIISDITAIAIGGKKANSIAFSEELSYANRVTRVLQNHHGGFGEPVTLETEPETNPNGSAIAVGDINGDGHDDIVRGSDDYHSTLELHYSDTKSGFKKGVSLDTQVKQTHSIVLGDVSGDGKLDIIFASMRNNEVSLLVNDGKGNFSTKQVLNNTLESPKHVDVEDINNDGLNDIVVTYDRKGVIWLPNEGEARFTHTRHLMLPNNINSVTQFSDFDKDGDVDMVVSGALQHSIHIYKNRFITETSKTK